MFEIDENGMCCPINDNCEKERLTPCAEKAKKEYEEYLISEECKPEEEVTFNICRDYDPSEIYFLQYRSKRAFYNEWWKKDMYKDIYNINKNKRKSRGGT